MDANDICSNLPEKIRKLLTAYHIITGSEPTLYPFGVGKVKPFKKALKKDKSVLLQCFQNEEDKEIKPAKKFVQTIMYLGKNDDSSAEERSRMYEKQKQKSSSNLIPEQSILHEHLKRAKLQTMIWNQCCEQNFVYLDPIDYG